MTTASIEPTYELTKWILSRNGTTEHANVEGYINKKGWLVVPQWTFTSECDPAKFRWIESTEEREKIRTNIYKLLVKIYREEAKLYAKETE